MSYKSIQAAPITYGKKNESKARANYLAKFPSRHVHDCGFVINNEFPFLGATPDGVICDGGQVGILEIKSPYSARDITVNDACTHLQGFLMQKNENDELSLKKTHPYYAQVQGQLMVTGCSFCDFVVFCPKERDLFVQRIVPDMDFTKDLLSELASFFKSYAQPYLTSLRAVQSLTDHNYFQPQ